MIDDAETSQLLLSDESNNKYPFFPLPIYKSI